MFVTSRECRSVTPEEASSYILGYTIGNDISCRFFQLPEQSGGQFFYAKAFDKFAPVGPVLVHPSVFAKSRKEARLVTRINGEVKQDTSFEKDMIYQPERVLSWMSQSNYSPMPAVIISDSLTLPRYNHPSLYGGNDRDSCRCWRFPESTAILERWRYYRGGNHWAWNSEEQGQI